MAVPPPLFCAVPAPTRDEAEALRLVEDYLKRAGTQVASRLLGCREPGREAALVAELGVEMLRCSAYCAELRGFADTDIPHGS